MLRVFTMETATRYAQLMQLEVENAQKSSNNVCIDRNKQQTRRHIRNLEVSKFEKRFAWFFLSQRTKPKRLMEHFQPLKTNNKLCLVYLQSKLQRDRRS